MWSCVRQNIARENLFLNAYNYIGQTHLKMITTARAIYLLKTTLNDLGIRLLLDFLKSDSTALIGNRAQEGFVDNETPSPEHIFYLYSSPRTFC